MNLLSCLWIHVRRNWEGGAEKRQGGGGRLGGYKHALDYLALSAPAFSTPIKGVQFGYQDSSDSNFWQPLCLRVNDHIAMILRLPLMSRQTYMQEIVIHSFMSNLHWRLSYDFSFVTERFTIRHTGADLGGGCRGCAPPPPPRDDLRFSNTTGILQKLCGLLVLK